MSQPTQSDAELALHRLGVRAREEWAKRHPAPDKSLAAFKDAVREDHERSKQVLPLPPKDHRDRQPDEPEPER